ncbi:hypothetical protein [Natronococcus pandeyae]|uniref:hypothetical protein n=1 Tax=Natronococcus pandeyae TaxID=2055836 RepID=UPI0016533864|nr:hypothetical protein [Natronococcus pandeyae]
MLDTNHSSQFDIDTTITDAVRERGRTLEELVLDLLEGEFAGVIRSHVRGEVYGGC